MPGGFCARCGASYDSPTITPNGPFCRFCLARGDVVVLQPVQRRRFSRARSRGALRAPSGPSRGTHAR